MIYNQYVIRHPEFFMNASPEHARVAPNQDLILLEHIRCAAFELPFVVGERFGPVAPDEYLAYLQDEEVVHLDVTKQVLASRLSIKPETFSRIVRDLCAHEVLQVEGRNFRILDRDALTDLADVCASPQDSLSQTFGFRVEVAGPER